MGLWKFFLPLLAMVVSAITHRSLYAANAETEAPRDYSAAFGDQLLQYIASQSAVVPAATFYVFPRSRLDFRMAQGAGMVLQIREVAREASVNYAMCVTHSSGQYNPKPRPKVTWAPSRLKERDRCFR
jgi:hypothetical protein